MEGVLFLKNNKQKSAVVSSVTKQLGQFGKSEQKQPEEDLTLGVNKAWDKRYCKVLNKKLMIYDGNYDASTNKGKLLDQIDIVTILSPYDINESAENTSRGDNIYAFYIKVGQSSYMFASFSSTVRERWVQEIQLIVRQEVQTKTDRLIGVPAKVVQDENKISKIGPVLDRVESYSLTILDLSDMNLLEIPKGKMVVFHTYIHLFSFFFFYFFSQFSFSFFILFYSFH